MSLTKQNLRASNNYIHEHMLSVAKKSPLAPALQFEDKVVSYQAVANGSTHIADCLRALNIQKDESIGIFIEKSFEAIFSIYGVLRAAGVYVPIDIKNPAARIRFIVKQSNITTVITSPQNLNYITTVLASLKKNIRYVVLSNKSVLQDTNEHGGERSATDEIADQHIYINPYAPTLNNYNLETSYQLETPHHLETRSHGEFSSKDSEFQNSNKDSIQQQESKHQQEFIHQESKNNDPKLAAILYTSGSTGVPKGVMMTHDSVCTFTQWAVNYFQLNNQDRSISHAPLHFDLSLLDIFASHRAGANVVLLPEKRTGNPKYITRLIAEQKITIWQSVPSALVLLLKYGDIEKQNYESLRHVAFAGERTNANNIKSLSSYFSSAIFHNIYGSTETNDTFIYSIPKDPNAYQEPLPIGKPLDYVEYKIVEPGTNKLSETNEGELLVKAPTIMYGYKHNLPFFEENPDGYYRTKDIVKILENGNLTFCGRTDDIVKSNGYRINLLEIENMLQTRKDIASVAVLAEPDDETGNRIIAAIVPAPNSTISPIELKIFCAAYLPKYAIPAEFEIWDTPFPKTSSGKTNKQAINKQRMQHVTTA